MLRSLIEIDDYAMLASNGNVGHVIDFLFDEEYWTLRYLIVETGEFFGGRQVLVSPIAFRHIDWSARRFQLSLSIDEIGESPSFDRNKPVSRLQEREFNLHFRYPYYWEFSGLWGRGAYPGLLAPDIQRGPSAKHLEETDSIHLHSAKEVLGYQVQGIDQAIGNVDDLLVDDDSWTARYLAVDAGDWDSGKRVLLAPHWAKQISWSERKIYVDVTRQSIRDCPEWKLTTAVHRDYEAQLYDFHGRPVYWDSTGRAIAPPLAHHASGRAAL